MHWKRSSQTWTNTREQPHSYLMKVYPSLRGHTETLFLLSDPAHKNMKLTLTNPLELTIPVGGLQRDQTPAQTCPQLWTCPCTFLCIPQTSDHQLQICLAIFITVAIVVYLPSLSDCTSVPQQSTTLSTASQDIPNYSYLLNIRSSSLTARQ